MLKCGIYWTRTVFREVIPGRCVGLDVETCRANEMALICQGAGQLPIVFWKNVGILSWYSVNALQKIFFFITDCGSQGNETSYREIFTHKKKSHRAHVFTCERNSSWGLGREKLQSPGFSVLARLMWWGPVKTWKSAHEAPEMMAQAPSSSSLLHLCRRKVTYFAAAQVKV